MKIPKQKYIVIIGNKGNVQRPDGQIMRTKNVVESLKNNYSQNYQIIFLNTAGRNLIFLLSKLSLLRSATRIVIMPGPRAYFFVLPLIYLLGLEHKTVHVAIGGWLPDYLKNNAMYERIEKRLLAVLVQTKSIQYYLEERGLNNAHWFPNYRRDTGEAIKKKSVEGPPRKFVFYSRVIKEKGVFEAINAIKKLHEDGEDVLLDIYGPINDEMLQTIKKISTVSNYIQYKKVLQQGHILSTLSEYDCMIFPTKYEGEGFPGAVLESMMAGVPVIATDWKYNSEIVTDRENGLICSCQTAEDVEEQIRLLIEDTDLYKKTCTGAYCEGKKYTEEKVLPILIATLSIDG